MTDTAKQYLPGPAGNAVKMVGDSVGAVAEEATKVRVIFLMEKFFSVKKTTWCILSCSIQFSDTLYSSLQFPTCYSYFCLSFYNQSIQGYILGV